MYTMEKVHEQPSIFAMLIDALRNKNEEELRDLYLRLIKGKKRIEKKKSDEKKVTFTALSIDTKGFNFNRDEANER